MTNDTNLKAARTSFLEQVNANTAHVDVLRQQLAALQAAHPALFVPYATAADQDPIDADPAQWNGKYFTVQKKMTERNFSRERVEHLLALRARLPAPRPPGADRRAPPVPVPRTPLPAAYTPSINLARFVERKEMATIRVALSMELNDTALDAATLRAAAAWTAGRTAGLFDPMVEKAFARAIIPDHAQWDAAYYDKQFVYLTTNFSEERFLHLVEVREFLRHQASPPPEPAAIPASRPAPPASGDPDRGAPLRKPAPRPTSNNRAAPPPPAASAASAATGGIFWLPAALVVGGIIIGAAALAYIIRKYA